MTVYTDESLTEWYEDDDNVIDFTGDDTGETVLLIDGGDIEEESPFIRFRYRRI